MGKQGKSSPIAEFCQSGLKLIAVQVFPAGTAPAPAVVPSDIGVTAARTNVGAITLRLDDKYKRVFAAQPAVHGGLGMAVDPGVFTARPADGGNSTYTFTTRTGDAAGAVADIASNVNNYVSVCMWAEKGGGA